MTARNVEDREVLIRELVTVMELMLARGQEWVPGSPEPGTPAGYLHERMDWLLRAGPMQRLAQRKMTDVTPAR